MRPEGNASPPLASLYSERLGRWRALAARLDHTGWLLANARLVGFLGAVALAIATRLGRVPPWGYGAALALAALFLAAAVAHDRVLARERRAQVRAGLNERALHRLEHRWEALPSRGERFLDPRHPYAGDLDLFGPASLFQLLDATTTRPSEERLAGWLRTPASLAEVAERQQAVRELTPQLDWREELETEGVLLAKERPDPGRFLEWAESSPAFSSRPLWRLSLIALPLVTLGAWLAGRSGVVPGATWLLPLAVQIGLVVATRRTVAARYEAVMRPGEKLARWDRVLVLLERLEPSSPRLRRMRQALAETGALPSQEMARLGRMLSFFQVREQPLFHLPLAVLALWDLNWLTALESWQRRCGPRVRIWLEQHAEVESLSSLARFAFENPTYAFPEPSGEGLCFVARGLGHPLIPASRRVVNDLELEGAGRALLVTGSNMAGKTTLLRTVGINAVLGLAGAPVCAERLVLSGLAVRTSMRVRDSLAEGVSLFYAEVRRLKAILDDCGKEPVLYLLDEVLQGTNTAERQLASRAIVLRLVELGAAGLIATHDLGLTTLEAETGGRVRNVHFTDQIRDGEMSFDYRLKPGVVATTNALALLRKEGIEIQAEG